MFNIEDLIEDSMNEPNVDKKKVIEILSKGLRGKFDECEVYEAIYREIYKNELIPEKCEELIKHLHQAEEHGSKWSLAETNNVASRLDFNFNEKPYTPEEFRTAMHIQYYDIACPMKKAGKEMSPSDWGRLADFYFMADDEPKTKLVDFYFWKMKNDK